ACAHLFSRSTDVHDGRRAKNPPFVVISGPDKGKVIPLKDGAIDFGPGGLDDPEPIYRIESTGEGTVLGVLPEAIEARIRNVQALIFEKIPATTNAAVIFAEGKPQGKKLELCLFLLPAD